MEIQIEARGEERGKAKNKSNLSGTRKGDYEGKKGGINITKRSKVWQEMSGGIPKHRTLPNSKSLAT